MKRGGLGSDLYHSELPPDIEGQGFIATYWAQGPLTNPSAKFNTCQNNTTLMPDKQGKRVCLLKFLQSVRAGTFAQIGKAVLRKHFLYSYY